LPGGALLENLSGSEAPRRLDLPPLPPQFHYTDLFAGNSCLLLPWEQADFIQVGAAGLYIRPLSSGKEGG
jgi:hypothetical protein